MTERQKEIWDALCELDSERVLVLLTDWYGLQLFDDEFYGFLIDEGIIDEHEE